MVFVIVIVIVIVIGISKIFLTGSRLSDKSLGWMR